MRYMYKNIFNTHVYNTLYALSIASVQKFKKQFIFGRR